MHTPRSTVIGRLSVLLVISLGLVSPAVAQKPSQAQINAVRQACPADYQTYCSNVPTGGSASLACLKRNAQSLSEPCQQAVAAISNPAPAAQNPRQATAPTAPAATGPGAAASAPAEPAARTYGPPMSPRQEAMLLRRACGMDYRIYCSEVPPGGGRIIECLRENGPSLSRQCRSALLSARQGR
jgi:hypothetical protein